MSELNDAIKPILIANGYEKIDELPDGVSDFAWNYQYSNGVDYIYFDEQNIAVCSKHNNDVNHQLHGADANEVIAYFTKHSKAPAQHITKPPFAAQMWQHLLDAGFSPISGGDERLGLAALGNWDYAVAKDNLCFYDSNLDDDVLKYVQIKNIYSCTKHVGIESIADLDKFIAQSNCADAPTISSGAIDATIATAHSDDVLERELQMWKHRALSAEQALNSIQQVLDSVPASQLLVHPDEVQLGQQMWDYLLSVGFEEIDNRDSRLGCQTDWKYTIAKGNLCAFQHYLTEKFIGLIDETINLDALTDTELNIHSVSDLQAWLQDNGYLDDAITK